MYIQSFSVYQSIIKEYKNLLKNRKPKMLKPSLFNEKVISFII